MVITFWVNNFFEFSGLFLEPPEESLPVVIQGTHDLRMRFATAIVRFQAITVT